MKTLQKSTHLAVSESIMQYLTFELEVALNLWKTSFPILTAVDVDFTDSNPDNTQYDTSPIENILQNQYLFFNELKCLYYLKYLCKLGLFTRKYGMNTMDGIFGLTRWSFFGFVMQYRKQGSKKKTGKKSNKF